MGHESSLREYEKFLRDHRGFSASTIERLLDHAGRLCRTLNRARLEHWDELTPDLLYGHLRRQARTLGPASLQSAQGALRSFFRFLRLTGRGRKNLDGYFISYRSYSLSAVPQTVSLDDLHRLFDLCRGDAPELMQSRTVLLLLTLYGLRIGEIVRLRLDDIRWREEQLVIRRRKSGRDLVLPLHPAVAQTLREYLDRARPQGTAYREVFLSHWSPHPYPRGSSLGGTLRRRLRRLGIPHFRPHAFRHSLASHLINNGCPPEWIQVLLGHRSFSSTQIYAKVDLAHLREVAENDGVDL